MTMQDEQLKRALRPPWPGLITIAPGLYGSKRSVSEIREDLERAGQLKPAPPQATPEPPADN